MARIEYNQRLRRFGLIINVDFADHLRRPLNRGFVGVVLTGTHIQPRGLSEMVLQNKGFHGRNDTVYLRNRTINECPR